MGIGMGEKKKGGGFRDWWYFYSEMLKKSNIMLSYFDKDVK